MEAYFFIISYVDMKQCELYSNLLDNIYLKYLEKPKFCKSDFTYFQYYIKILIQSEHIFGAFVFATARLTASKCAIQCTMLVGFSLFLVAWHTRKRMCYTEAVDNCLCITWSINTNLFTEIKTNFLSYLDNHIHMQLVYLTNYYLPTTSWPPTLLFSQGTLGFPLALCNFPDSDHEFHFL